MKNNSTHNPAAASSRSVGADLPVLTDTLKRLRNQTPAESLGLPAGSGLLGPFLQAAVVTLVLLALLTVVPYFVAPTKTAEAKGPPQPNAEQQQPAETPKDQTPPANSKATPEAIAKTPGTKAPPGNKGDILNKLGETGTKTAPLQVNPLDKKDDDLLKDIK